MFTVKMQCTQSFVGTIKSQVEVKRKGIKILELDHGWAKIS